MTTWIGCELTTTTGYRYSNYYPLAFNEAGETQLGFLVMAQRDAHIVLTTSVLGLNPVYEIVIGASSNNYTGMGFFSSQIFSSPHYNFQFPHDTLFKWWLSKAYGIFLYEK